MQKEEEYIAMILFNLPVVEKPNNEDNTAPLHAFPEDHQNMQKALISLCCDRQCLGTLCSVLGGLTGLPCQPFHGREMTVNRTLLIPAS